MSNLKKRAPLEDLIFQSSSPVTYKENGQDGGKKILLHALGLSLKNSAGVWVVVVVVDLLLPINIPLLHDNAVCHQINLTNQASHVIYIQKASI